MIRNAIRVTKILLITLATPAALVFSAPPAGAASAVTVCETFGPYCVGAPTLSPNAAVMEVTGGGRNLIEARQTNPFEGLDTYRLIFSGNQNLCIGTSGANAVTVQNCDNGTGVVWALENAGAGADFWINRHLSQVNGEDVLLSGLNNAGQMAVTTQGGISGALQRFTNSPAN